jgi:hypothetical protein
MTAGRCGAVPFDGDGQSPPPKPGATFDVVGHRPHCPSGFSGVLALLDRFDDPRREHHAVEQRIRREAVGAVHAVACRLAGCPQTRQRRSTVEIRDHATTQVVRRRCDRQPVAGRIEPDLLERGCDRRKALVEPFELRGVEPQVINVLFQHARGHRT